MNCRRDITPIRFFIHHKSPAPTFQTSVRMHHQPSVYPSKYLSRYSIFHNASESATLENLSNIVLPSLDTMACTDREYFYLPDFFWVFLAGRWGCSSGAGSAVDDDDMVLVDSEDWVVIEIDAWDKWGTAAVNGIGGATDSTWVFGLLTAVGVRYCNTGTPAAGGV